MKTLILGIISIIVVIVVSVLIWFFTSSQKSPTTSTNPVVTFPGSGSIQVSTSTSNTSGNTMTIATLGGGTVTTNDFIHNGVTLPDTANAGRYLLIGDLGYCPADPKECQAGPETDFSIFYDSAYGSFTIGLLQEPLGQVRVDMEHFLINTLGITQGDMCRLNYYVGTTADVNPTYSTKNLGFSFCPGATVLPK